MTTRVRSLAILAAAAVVLGACAQGEPELLNIRQTQEGPDEFAILPSKPLETPPSYAELPPPTRGQANRVDATPRADAVAALGGNPARLTRDGQSGDSALIAHSSRYGRDDDIRAKLAAADLEFRKANRGRILERWANVNVYFDAYDAQSLDQHAELERLRRAGVRTPSAPPDPEKD